MIAYNIKLETLQYVNSISISNTWLKIFDKYSFFIERMDGKAYRFFDLIKKTSLESYLKKGKTVASHDIVKYWNFYTFHGHRNDFI